MTHNALWTPEIDNALREGMDPFKKIDLAEDFLRLSRALSETGANRYQFNPSSFIVRFETEQEQEEFWEHWRSALGDVAMMYEERMVKAAIDDIVRNNKRSPLDHTVSWERRASHFDLRLLLFLNPNLSLVRDMNFGINWRYEYSKESACTVYCRHNPTAPSDLSMNMGSFCEYATPQDIARFVTMFKATSLEHTMSRTDAMKEAPELAARAAGLEELSNEFTRLRVDKAQGLSPAVMNVVSSHNFSVILSDMFHYQNTIDSIQPSHPESLRWSKMSEALDFLQKIISSLFTSLTEHQQVSRVEATALVLSFMNHYASVLGASPYPSLYEFLL